MKKNVELNAENGIILHLAVVAKNATTTIIFAIELSHCEFPS